MLKCCVIKDMVHGLACFPELWSTCESTQRSRDVLGYRLEQLLPLLPLVAIFIRHTSSVEMRLRLFGHFSGHKEHLLQFFLFFFMSSLVFEKENAVMCCFLA